MQIFMTPEGSMCLTLKPPLHRSGILVWNSANINKKNKRAGYPSLPHNMRINFKSLKICGQPENYLFRRSAPEQGAGPVTAIRFHRSPSHIMSIECWKFINSFAPWFSASGTLLAVVVSLYIALSSRKISIDISSGVFDSGNGNELLIIKVTNTGFRTVVINHPACIRFQAGRFKKKKNIVIGSNYIDQQKTSTFPWRLTEGETAELVVNIKNNNGNWLQNFKKNYLTGISVNTLKVIVFPNVSKPFKESADSTIINELK